MPPTENLLPAAHPWRRFMGIIYEGVILFGVLWFFNYAFSALTRFQGEPGMLRHAFQAFQVLILGTYFVYFWSCGRRSLPMKTMSLQLLTTQGEAVNVSRATLRYVIALVLLLIPMALAYYIQGLLVLLVLLPFSWTVLDPDSQALYDRLADTRLTVTPDK
ncbi:MAG: RDD family protein [Burkholderiaceae bacterium]